MRDLPCVLWSYHELNNAITVGSNPMKMLTKILAYLLFVVAGQGAHAASCSMVYSYFCKGLEPVYALDYEIRVNCATGAAISSKEIRRSTCEIDYSRNASKYTASYFCSELGLKSAIPGYSGGIYSITYFSTGGGTVHHSCDINLPKSYKF